MKTEAFSPDSTRLSDGALDAAADFARRLIGWARHWRQARRNLRLLAALDDRLLADLGIARHELRQIARAGRLPDRT